MKRGVLVFNHFADKLQELFAGFDYHFSARAGCLVILALFPSHDRCVAFQKAQPLELVQRRVECALAQPVAVADEFFSDLGPVNRLLGRVVQDVQTDKAVEKMTRDRVVGHNVGFRCWIST